MRLRSLEVRNIRGVRALSLVLPAQGNLVLLGPNGAGKSSVVDALDFLLTGSVQRLTGEGAGELSLAEHGRNLLAAPNESWVQATFAVQESSGIREVKVTRNVSEPGKLAWEGKPSPKLEAVFARFAASKHHLLARRSIVRYILAAPKSRLEQISALMQLDEIEELRLEFQGAAKRGREDLKAQKAKVSLYERNLLSCVAPAARDPEDLLARTNACRAALGAGPIAELLPALIRDDVKAPGVHVAHPLQSAHVKGLLASLQARLFEQAALAARVRTSVEEVRALRADREAIVAHKAREIVSLGLDQATDEVCPLCLTPWDLEELKALLRSRLAASEEASERVRSLIESQSALATELEMLCSDIDSLATVLGPIDDPRASALRSYSRDLRSASAVVLPDPLSTDAPSSKELDAFGIALLAVGAAVKSLVVEAAGLPPLEGVVQAWTDLDAIERGVAVLEAARAELPATERLADALTAAEKSFAAARDEVLSSAYAQISGRLEKLYIAIHEKGDGAEDRFSAVLAPERAGLRFEVDFYGKGRYPPSALHSEGHQDTLGICLFLALAEHVAGGSLPLILLDDVLMSVDAEHRRAVAELLKNELPSTQLIITTHDRVWARQLRSVGVGKPVELRTTSLEDGARSSTESTDPIASARARLAEGNVAAAAHALRRGLEARFQDLCESLGGKVRFKSNGDYDFGDFRDGVKERFASLIDETIKSARSWGRDLSGPTKLKESYAAARSAVEAHDWIVNPTVHNNDWLDAQASDLEPILDAYEAFLAFFTCAECQRDLGIVESPQTQVKELRCTCGATNWNLAPRPSDVQTRSQAAGAGAQGRG